MPHERLYQYSSLGLDFSTCLQSHTILLQFLIKNIAKLGFNWSLTYLQSICLSTKTEMVINITYINIYSWLYKYLFDFQNKVFLLLCLQSLYSIECPLPSQYYTLFFLQLTFMVFIYFNVATVFIILVASNKSCAFKIQKFSVTYWKVISR